jgi:RNA polymerase sigma-70 factor (ECF subfamily)
VNPVQSQVQRAAPNVTDAIREFAPFVWRALRRLGVHERDAADVCQEVFMVVHQKIAEFEGRSSLRAWVYGICVRKAADYRKKASRRYEIVTDALPERVANDNPLDAVAGAQERLLIDRALSELDEGRRAVFVLYEIEGLTMAEVAEAVGCPVQTAYSRLHSARDAIAVAIRRIREGSN